MSKFKPLKYCANGDGNPVCPPSKVICRKCLDKISSTLQEMVDEMRHEREANQESHD